MKQRNSVRHRKRPAGNLSRKCSAVRHGNLVGLGSTEWAEPRPSAEEGIHPQGGCADELDSARDPVEGGTVEGATVGDGVVEEAPTGVAALRALASRERETDLGASIARAGDQLRVTILISPFCLAWLRSQVARVKAGVLRLQTLVPQAPDSKLAQLDRSLETLSRALFDCPGVNELSRVEPLAASLAQEFVFSPTLMQRLWQEHLARASQLHFETTAAHCREDVLLEIIRRVARAHENHALAVGELVQHNLRLVGAVAKRYRMRGVSFSDLLQEGNIGLIMAAERFDPSVGTRFSTYAVWWIRAAVQLAIANQGRMIRVPVRRLQEMSRLASAERKLTAKLERNPTGEELRQASGFAAQDVNRMRAVPRDAVAFTSVNREDGLSLDETLMDPEAISPFESLASRELRTNTERLLNVLSARERRIICLRFGIGTGSDHTLEEIGQRLGVTRERVRQLESRALRKLRAARTAAGIDSRGH